MITASQVKELRDKTGAGMMDCKNALKESEGDMEKAIQILREKDLATAAKKASRTAAEGMVESYIHGDGRIGVLIEVNTETDFASKNEEFRAFVKDAAMTVAAMNPDYIKREDVPKADIEKEKEILRNQALEEGKPEKIVDKIVEGRIEKFYNRTCLLEQVYIRDEDKTLQEVLIDLIGKIGENIVVRRFVRYERGEGIEKKKENFAEEVKEQMKQ